MTASAKEKDIASFTFYSFVLLLFSRSFSYPLMSGTPQFLDLPPVIRHRIYEHLIPDDEIHFPTKSFTRHTGPQFLEITECDRDCRSLLLTCRLVYNELAPTVYSTKHFIAQYRNSHLQKLQQLTATAVQSLVKLTIFLTVRTCEPGWSCCQEQSTHSHHDCTHQDEPLSSTSLQYEEVISEWYRTVDRLVPDTHQSRLHLNLACDVADATAATAVVTPLMIQGFPVLAECNIRLSKDIDPSMQTIAYRAAKQSIGQSISDPTKPFPFLSFPTELRHQILRHTDLVTPYRQVDWNPRDGYYLHYSVRGCSWDCDPDDHHGCQFRQCWKCIDTHGCFCSRYHSVSSTHCRCWRPPIPLFLVCKALRDDAQDVFFIQNRFIIAPIDGYGNPAKPVLERFEASIFLQDIMPIHFLSRLKFLEIVFPPLDEDYISSRGLALHDWDNTIDNMKDKLDLPNLTLRVYFADFYTITYTTPLRRQLTRAEGIAKVVKAYMRMIRPFKVFKENGLQNFFLHAAWPWSWTPEGINTRIRKNYIVENDISIIERRLGKNVMGEDYDSEHLGKHGLEKNQWLKAHERSEQFATVVG